jgi:hypothetical protein
MSAAGGSRHKPERGGFSFCPRCGRRLSNFFALQLALFAVFAARLRPDRGVCRNRLGTGPAEAGENRGHMSEAAARVSDFPSPLVLNQGQWGRDLSPFSLRVGKSYDALTFGAPRKAREGGHNAHDVAGLGY